MYFFQRGLRRRCLPSFSAAADAQSLRMEKDKTARLQNALWQEGGAAKRDWETTIEVNIPRSPSAYLHVAVLPFSIPCGQEGYRPLSGPARRARTSGLCQPLWRENLCTPAPPPPAPPCDTQDSPSPPALLFLGSVRAPPRDGQSDLPRHLHLSQPPPPENHNS